MLIWVFTAAAVLCLVYYGSHRAVCGIWHIVCSVMASDRRIFRGDGSRHSLFIRSIRNEMPLWLPVSFVTLCASGLMILLVTQILIFGRIPAAAEPSAGLCDRAGRQSETGRIA